MDVVVTLAVTGASLFFAFFASAAFRRTHIPDILWLLLLGALLGPVLGLMDVEAVRAFLPFVAALALILVLFDGALEVNPVQLRSYGSRSVMLSMTVFSGATFACALVGRYVAGLEWPVALLLGMCFGGAGIAIIVPLAQRMEVSRAAMTVILLEAVTSDLLVIVGIFIASTVLVQGATGLGIATPLLLAVGIAAAVGLAAGWAWSRLLSRRRDLGNVYMLTLAALVLVYAASEALKGSGPLAVLLFGLVLGNARTGRRAELRSPVFGGNVITFHHEVVFLVRAFFFVSLGAVTDWGLLTDRRFLAAGLLLTWAVAAVRACMVTLVLPRKSFSTWDRAAAAVLFPMGLVTAAVSVVPASMGVPGTQHLHDYASVVIILTNVLSTVGVFLASTFFQRPAEREDLERLLPDSPSTPASAPQGPS
jgi:cell volume regulation protein A